MTKETYYAVRLGTKPRYIPYFMLGSDAKTPALFRTREEADEACPKGDPAIKVVHVTLTGK